MTDEVDDGTRDATALDQVRANRLIRGYLTDDMAAVKETMESVLRAGTEASSRLVLVLSVVAANLLKDFAGPEAALGIVDENLAALLESDE